MANINLLPDDFRQREQKELKKASRISKETRVELSGGGKPAKVGADQDKPSFWERLFGTSGSKKTSVSRRIASAEEVEKSTKVASQHTVPVSTQQKAIYQPRTTRWADILGTGVVKPDSHAASHVVHKSAHSQEQKHYSVIIDKKEATQANNHKHQRQISDKPGTTMGWWQIIRSIFVPTGKMEPQMPVASSNHHKQHKTSGNSSQQIASEKKGKSLHDAPKTSKLSIDVNLIPQELLVKKHWSPTSQIILVVAAIVVPALLVTGIYVGIMQLQGATDRDITFEKQRMDSITAAVAQLHKRQAIDRHLERKLVAIDGLMQHHIKWSNFFAQLEKHTLDSVYYTDIKADISGELVLPAVAPTYEVAAQQLVAFQQADDFIADAQVNSMQVLTDSKKGVVGVSFNLKIVLQDDVLLAP